MAERDRSETMMERILAYKHSTEQMKKEMLKLIESEAGTLHTPTTTRYNARQHSPRYTNTQPYNILSQLPMLWP